MSRIYDPDRELLSGIYKSMRSGADNLVSVTPKIRDRFMLTNVTSQIEKIGEFTDKTEKMLRSRSLMPREPSRASRLASRGSIAVSTFIDPGRSAVAGLIRRGSFRGARRLGAVLERCRREGCDPDAAALCREVIAYRLGEADRMREFM